MNNELGYYGKTKADDWTTTIIFRDQFLVITKAVRNGDGKTVYTEYRYGIYIRHSEADLSKLYRRC